MAHVAKFGAGGYEAILRHCERSLEATRERANIDAERTKYNYEMGDGDVRERVRECMEMHNDAGRALRDDAVLMANWVVTKPRDLPDDRTREFFRETYEFIQGRYGKDNVPRAYVHMDETTPHMHCPVVPFDDQAHRLRASAIITRGDLRTFHGDLAEHIERTMGRRYAVELTEEQRQERAVEYKPMREFQDAQDRLELVRRRGDDAERGLARLEKRRPGIRVGSRERAARERNRGLREALRAARSRLRDAGEKARQIAKEIGQLRGRIAEAKAEKRELEKDNSQLRARIREHEQTRYNAPAPDREQEREPDRQLDREPGRSLGHHLQVEPDQEQLQVEPDRENVIGFPEFDFEPEMVFLER